MISDAEFLAESKREFEASLKHTTAGGGALKDGKELHPGWRKETKDGFDFVAGRQWDRADEENLNSSNRPIVTFNRVEPMLRAICGVEINNRQEIHFDPALPEDNNIASIPNTAAKIMLSRGEFPDEESEAFFHMLVCGMGFVEHYMDYDENPDGDLTASVEDPLEFFWDPKARKQNLRDARWIGQMKRLSRAAFEDMFPGQEGETKTFGYGQEDESRPDIARLNPPDIYKGISTAKDIGGTEDFSVYRRQYWVLEPIYRVPDPNGGKPSTLTEEQFQPISKAMAEAKTPMIAGQHYIKQQTRVYYQGFISGETVLKHEKLPCQTGFTTKCMTGLRDRNRNTWYGVLRSMKDPARYSNKFFSWQIFAFLASVKGGFMYEEAALAGQNEEAFKNDATKPNAMLKLADGGLAKIEKLEPTQYPGLGAEQNLAIGALPAVTGLNVEFMGTAERDQPGVLEQARKMASMTILAPTFSALRRFRLQSAKLVLEYMKKYYSAPRLQQMVGQELAPLVEQFLAKDDLQYDLLLDDAPESPSIKSAVYAFFTNWMQQDPQNASKFADIFIQYSPLPGPLADAMEKRMQTMGQPSPEQQQAQAAALSGAISKALKDYTQAELNKAQAGTVAQEPDLQHEQNMTSLLTHHTGLAADVAKHVIPSADTKLKQQAQPAPGNGI